MAENAESLGRKVFIAMDGSTHSDLALDFYVKNIYKENDDIIVTYCVHHRAKHDYGSKWMPVDPKIIVNAYHEESKKGDEVCKTLKEKLETYNVGGRVLKLEGGDPGHTIIHKAQEIGIDLIVVGCRGHGTIRRTIMGSVSEFILHHSDIPVLVCRH